MNKDLKNVFNMLNKFKAEIVLVFFLYFGIRILPNKSIYTVVLAITTVILIYQLYKNIVSKSKPEFKSYALTIVRTPIVISIIYFVIKFFGGYGIIGFIIIILLLVAWRLWKSWKLYISVVDWGARRLKGITDEPFNIDGEKENGFADKKE